MHPKSRQILEYGAVVNDLQYRGIRKQKLVALSAFAPTICGHNIMAHDLPLLLQQDLPSSFFQKFKIDTLYLSVLLFPKKPYHPLVKEYQLDGTELNNPIADAVLSRQLLSDLLIAFQALPEPLKIIYSSLLKAIEGFDGFFKLFPNTYIITSEEKLNRGIHKYFGKTICGDKDLRQSIINHPIELAFALAFISIDDADSLLPNWIKHRFPTTISIINELRLSCMGDKACPYCNRLSPTKGLQRFFGFDSFRRFDEKREKSLQQEVVETALANKSLLAIFPTGGGKSLTFQLPALMKGEANRSLTVVISPLQSLMKDQVDVLRNRHDITTAVTINGMLSPLERTEALERVETGGVNLLYISPESLRSKTITRLLYRRQINRIVVDEAHCFSAWGQDFRVDYLYIGKFLKKLKITKRLAEPIPVSCFTATAKPKVIDDICAYFKEHLELELAVFKTSAKRKNLAYFVIKADSPEKKFEKLKELLLSEEGPKIVYTSRVKRAEELVENLQRAQIKASAYHGQLPREVKIRIQDEFMSPESDTKIIIATSAFGMGVDKDNIKMVIHYNISDSLENYMQESGRAGRKANLQAKCYILFDNSDLDAHFNLLNLTKLSHKEVYQIWQGLKGFKSIKFTRSALEIAKKAGWDTEMRDLETRVKVALSALEESGYVKREENAPRIFAQSILVKNVAAAQEKMSKQLHHFSGEEQYTKAQRIFSSLLSRAKTGTDTRIDSIADTLAIEKNEVTTVLNIFKEIGILSNNKDLTAYYFTVQGKRNSINLFKRVQAIEKAMFHLIFPNEQMEQKNIYLREINESINESGVDCDLIVIREILNYWTQVQYIHKERIDQPNNQYRIFRKIDYQLFRNHLEERLLTAGYCLSVFQQQFLPKGKSDALFSDKVLINFSVLDLKKATEKLHPQNQPIRFYEFLLLYFHHLKIIELKDGLLVYYNPMVITREIQSNRKQYTKEDYQQLSNHYQSKIEQIHIVGEYAKKQLENNIAATTFIDDYFTLPYEGFLSKYFNKRKTSIKQPITAEKFARIFGELSTEQLGVVRDNQHDNILVAAGPGSGKTRVLVHKVASLLLMEDVKPEQFLMLTFSRPAALEFKTRLRQLVGGLAYQIDIFTYHGFAFQLAGRLGTIERSQNILSTVRLAIEQEEIPLERIQTKSVIVVDEYQDVSKEEYEFIMAIANKADKIRIIAAGDDDQNIYEFRGSNVQYMRNFIREKQAALHYLTINFRSKYNLLNFTNLYLNNQFSAERIKHKANLVAHHQKNGSIEIVKYTTSNMIPPLVAQLKSKNFSGTTAILTHTNKEAVLINSLLNQEGYPAALISDKQGFSLRDLLELRTFQHFLFNDMPDEVGLITNEKWATNKSKLFDLYSTSRNLDLIQRVITSFEQVNPNKFKSVWKSYLKEIRIEDFYHPEKETILVSTMHKSKGKEFDNVFVLLNNYPLNSESRKRVLYVAMTRAKTNLLIHTNSIDFDSDEIANIHYAEDTNTYATANTIVLECGMKDVWLGFVKKPYVIQNIKELKSGMVLLPNTYTSSIFEAEGKRAVLQLSKKMEQQLNGYLQSGYMLQSTVAKYVVVWYDIEANQTFRVVLPEFILEK